MRHDYLNNRWKKDIINIYTVFFISSDWNDPVFCSHLVPPPHLLGEFLKFIMQVELSEEMKLKDTGKLENLLEK